jgi:hypothetical protein
MPDRSRGRSHTKRDILVLQWGVGREANLTVKTKLLRNHIISLGWREELRQIFQEAKAHPEL